MNTVKIIHPPTVMLKIVNFGVKHKLAKFVNRMVPSDWTEVTLSQDGDRNKILGFVYDETEYCIQLGRYNVQTRMRIIQRKWNKYLREHMAQSAGLFIQEKLAETSFADAIFSLQPSPGRTLRDRDQERRRAAALNARRQHEAAAERLKNKTKLYHSRLLARWSTEGIPWEYIPPPPPASNATFLARLNHKD